MSKYVKDLLAKDISNRLEGVTDCVLANVIGLDANTNVALRKRLREKEIRLLVVKNSLACRATEGTALAPAFEGITGTNAVLWGAEDFVSLVKEVEELDKDEAFDDFKTRGGIMDGEQLSPERVTEIDRTATHRYHVTMSKNSQLNLFVVDLGSIGALQIRQHQLVMIDRSPT